MPDKETIARARKDKRAGKSAGTQAGEFVHDEIAKIRHGEHGARSPQQAIAIGLSEARRAGVDLPPPPKGKAKRSTRKSAEYAYEAGQGERKTAKRPRVSKAVTSVLKREPRAKRFRMMRCPAQAKRAAAKRSRIAISRCAQGLENERRCRAEGCGEEGGKDEEEEVRTARLLPRERMRTGGRQQQRRHGFLSESEERRRGESRFPASRVRQLLEPR